MAQTKLTFALAALLASLVALSCASRPPEPSAHPLLATSVRTADGALSGNIPVGWSSVASDTVPPGVAAWLVRDDRMAVIALREIVLDRQSAQRVREEGLTLVAKLSMAFREAGAAPLAEYRLRELPVCSFETNAGGERRSVVVFGIRGRYYECEAASKDASQEAVRSAAEAQRAFLSSLTTSNRE